MSKYIVLICGLIFFSNCSKVPNYDLQELNGYWEIEQVKLHNGKEKKYNVNQTIDYIEISDSLIGFRKKLKPNLSGSYQMSMDAEVLKILIENDSINMYYTTPYSKWKETILSVNNSSLKIINQNNDVFLYKRFEPINIEQ